MGYGRWNPTDWDTYSSSTRGKSTKQVFNATAMKQNMDPRGITMRESRDSATNPQSTPIILALDVTGSMGMIADSLARKGLGRLVEEILERKPVTDPHIMVMGVGDAACDHAPLQVSQFEPDIRIAEQLKDIYLEGNGGGNDHESYTLPWYFAAHKTEIDCTSHGRKGILITFGDEKCPPDLTRRQIERVLGDQVQADIPTQDLLALVSKKYDVFHVVVEEGNYALHFKQAVYDSWEKVLPKERIIPLKDYTKLAEVVVSVMQIHSGKPAADVIASWQGDAVKAAVADAVENIQQKPQAAPRRVKIVLRKKDA